MFKLEGFLIIYFILREQGTDGLIFVVDSADVPRLAEARQELMNIILHEDMAAHCPVVVSNVPFKECIYMWAII